MTLRESQLSSRPFPWTNLGTLHLFICKSGHSKQERLKAYHWLAKKKNLSVQQLRSMCFIQQLSCFVLCETTEIWWVLVSVSVRWVVTVTLQQLHWLTEFRWVEFISTWAVTKSFLFTAVFTFTGWIVNAWFVLCSVPQWNYQYHTVRISIFGSKSC